MDPAWHHNCKTFRTGHVTWSLDTPDAIVQAHADDVFGDCAAPVSDVQIAIALHPAPQPGEFTFELEGSVSTLPLHECIDRVIGRLNRAIRDESEGTVDLHASAATDASSGMTVVATAPSGSGKTSIAAALCARGWAYLSDETVGIRTTDGSLVGCGKPLTVKRGLNEALGIDLAPLSTSPGQPRWYVRPALLGGSIQHDAPPPTDLVFIDLDLATTGTTIDEVAPHQALLQLLPNTYRLDRHGADVLPALARVVAGARCWQVRTNDASEAVEALIAKAASRPLHRHELACHESSAMSGAEAERPTPAPNTVFARLGDHGAVVYDHARSKAILLDATGAEIWQQLDGQSTAAEIVSTLAPHFAADATTIAADVNALLDELVASGFLADVVL